MRRVLRWLRGGRHSPPPPPHLTGALMRENVRLRREIEGLERALEDALCDAADAELRYRDELDEINARLEEAARADAEDEQR